ncbi:MAG: hypothetical protein RIT10_932 [Bacteroidota bacterium]|jgi:hypothetical protein
MKKQTIVLLAASAFKLTALFAQEATPSITDKKCSFHITEVQLQNGFQLNPMPQTNLLDFQTMAPNSALLATDFSSFSLANRQATGGSFHALSVGIKFKKSNPTLRLGIAYLMNNNLNMAYEKVIKYAYDTLTSSQSGTQTILTHDSLYRYSMTNLSKQLRLDAALIFRTNESARWSLYAGVGASLGYTIESTTRIDYTIENVDLHKSKENTIASRQTEIFENKNYLTSSIYAPLGIDFRMGKKREFWKHLHLTYELKPSINFVAIPEIKTATVVGIVSTGGIRYSF